MASYKSIFIFVVALALFCVLVYIFVYRKEGYSDSNSSPDSDSYNVIDPNYTMKYPKRDVSMPVSFEDNAMFGASYNDSNEGIPALKNSPFVIVGPDNYDTSIGVNGMKEN